MGTDKNGTEEDAWEAAKLAAVDGDIRNMPMQMQTFVPHGGGDFLRWTEAAHYDRAGFVQKTKDFPP